jgi:hypothetical protein
VGKATLTQRTMAADALPACDAVFHRFSSLCHPFLLHSHHLHKLPPDAPLHTFVSYSDIAHINSAAAGERDGHRSTTMSHHIATTWAQISQITHKCYHPCPTVSDEEESEDLGRQCRRRGSVWMLCFSVDYYILRRYSTARCIKGA